MKCVWKTQMMPPPDHQNPVDMHTSIMCINILQNIKAVAPKLQEIADKPCIYIRTERGKLICPPPPDSSSRGHKTYAPLKLGDTMNCYFVGTVYGRSCTKFPNFVPIIQLLRPSSAVVCDWPILKIFSKPICKIY